MKQKVEEAIQYCIEALNNSDIGNDMQVMTTIHETANLPYRGRGLGIGDFGAGDFRHSWKDVYIGFERKKNISHSLDWKNALLLLCDFADHNEDKILEVSKKISNDIIFNHIIKHIITNLVIQKQIDQALKLIPNFRKTNIFKEEDNLDLGYLIILKHYALQGDSENFFKYFRLSKPSTNKSEINDLKGILVENYTSKNGIDDSINLCKHKNLGNKFLFSVLYPFAKQGKYQDLKIIFDKHPELKSLEPEDELNILITAYLNARRNDFLTDDDFEYLFERALNIDRKIRAGDVKLQDALLLELGMANKNNMERVMRCKKAIKDNRLKKEL